MRKERRNAKKERWYDGKRMEEGNSREVWVGGERRREGITEEWGKDRRIGRRKEGNENWKMRKVVL